MQAGHNYGWSRISAKGAKNAGNPPEKRQRRQKCRQKAPAVSSPVPPTHTPKKLTPFLHPHSTASIYRTHRKTHSLHHTNTMLIDDDALFLYHLTLRTPSLTLRLIFGLFSGAKKAQELVLATPTTIEVWRPDSETGKMSKLCVQNTFGVVQNIAKVRPPGSQKDLLVISSDSGKIVVAEYNVDKAQFIPVVQETHSKNGITRLNPGQYLCVDPNNRALMVSAIQKNKLLYKIETNDGKLELSSPLEASSKLTLTLQLCALDTSYENPVFAAIEVDYSDYNDAENPKVYAPESSPLTLNYYEFDQGLNHIVRRRAPKPLPASSSQLIPLPGHIGGVLVCSDSMLIYDKLDGERLYLPLPVRKTSAETVVTAHVLHRLKKNNFFILVQSSLGDLFKITTVFDEEKELIEEFSATYFDTIPVCTSLSILKNGFLFADGARNNKHYYQFEDLGAENETTVKSVDFAPEKVEACVFEPSALQNLALIDIIETLDPIVDGTVVESASANSPDTISQLVTLSSHSYLKTLTHGIPTSTVVSSPLPVTPTAIHSTKLFSHSKNDEYLVISSSLSSQTLVLSIGEVVEEVLDSHFVSDQPTIAVQQVGKVSVVQIYTNGIRHIRHTANGEEIARKATDWYPPAGISILAASTNNEQVVIGLLNREMCYFEVDPLDDQLVEYQERLEMAGGSIRALSIVSSAFSAKKSPFAVVGCSDETIQVISLQNHNCLEIVTLQALSASCSSLVMLPLEDSTTVHIGLENGVYVRTSIDEITGKLSDTRVKYIGSKPVLLSAIGLPQLQQNGILAISSRPWLGYSHKNAFKISPLMDVSITSGASFYSDDIGGEGIVGIAGNDLVIFSVGSGNGEDADFNANNDFTIKNIQLRYSPRKMVVEKDRESPLVYVVESEYGTKPISDESDDYYASFGHEKSPFAWASCLQVVDFEAQEIVQTVEFENNESAVSLCIVDVTGEEKGAAKNGPLAAKNGPLAAKNGPQTSKNGSQAPKPVSDRLLIVGTVKDQKFLPNSFSGAFIYTYRIEKKGTKSPILHLLHKTTVDKPPSVVVPFNGRILAGMGSFLRIYDLGQTQLLRKTSSSIKNLKFIHKILDHGNGTFFIGDTSQSATLVKYDPTTNQFFAVAGDVMQRQISALAGLDKNTIVGGDKHGNIFVSRTPKNVVGALQDALVEFQDPFLNGSGARLANLCEFHIADVVTSFAKGSLVTGGKETVVYTGLQGTIGVLLPVATKHEVEFLVRLELLLRDHFDYNFDDLDEKNGTNLLGKDHAKFRGYYNPVKNVIDGDLLERFSEIKPAAKTRLAGLLDRTPREVERKIADMRSRGAF